VSGSPEVDNRMAEKRSLDLARGKTKICIGTSFERWRQLKEDKGLKTDAMVAELLLHSHCLRGACNFRLI
uniref:Uncharacterized protein n=1 Tax=Gouania willdenowi TaxID=441366 RepID=A0A8C5N755_GOUWI